MNASQLEFKGVCPKEVGGGESEGEGGGEREERERGVIANLAYR